MPVAVMGLAPSPLAGRQARTLSLHLNLLHMPMYRLQASHPSFLFSGYYERDMATINGTEGWYMRGLFVHLLLPNMVNLLSRKGYSATPSYLLSQRMKNPASDAYESGRATWSFPQDPRSNRQLYPSQISLLHGPQGSS